MTKYRNPVPAPVKKSLVISVTDVAFGGDGIARSDGKVIFVEHAVPGETVEAELLQDKKRFARARALRRLEPAPDQIEAFCPVFGTCGGCDWQHVPYAKQLVWKAAFIASALFKNARVEWPTPIVVLPSARQRNYRNRIKLKARVSAKATLEFGYFAKSSHTPVFIDGCPIADAPINAFLSDLKKVVFPKPCRWEGEVEVQVLTGAKRLVHFMPNLPEVGRATLAQKFPDDVIEEKGCVPFEEHDGLHYATQAGQFQQVNADGNLLLRDWITTTIAKLGAKTVLDLFCGSGNLTLQLLKQSDLSVWGLELAEQAIESAEFNLRTNALPLGRYRAGPVADLHALFQDLPAQLDCVITDPPRLGMDDSLAEVLQLRPKHILSISCDPNTFARDLKEMIAQGYALQEIFGIDFFPHTYHVETIALLSLEAGRQDSRNNGDL